MLLCPKIKMILENKFICIIKESDYVLFSNCNKMIPLLLNLINTVSTVANKWRPSIERTRRVNNRIIFFVQVNTIYTMLMQ